MPKKHKIDRELLKEVIEANQGVLSVVARKLNTSRMYIYRMAEKYPDVQEAIEQARIDYDDSLLDEAELGLRVSVRNGEPWAIKYTLETKGVARGYIKPTLAGAGKDGDVILRVVYDR